MVEAASVTVNLAATTESTIGSQVDVAAAAHWLRSSSRMIPPWRQFSMRVMPPRCVFCGQSGDLGWVDLCLDCLEALPWKDRKNESMHPDMEVFGSPSVLVPLRYAPPVDTALRDLKFHGELAPARVLGAVLAAVAALSGPLPDLLVPVPLHIDRLHDRGFNQAAHLARVAAGWLGRPCAPRLLERRRATQPQTSLESADRRRNVVGAFALAGAGGRWLARPGYQVRHVALVDDVLTTGATIQAAREALAGVEKVSCWAIAQPVSNSFTAGRG